MLIDINPKLPIMKAMKLSEQIEEYKNTSSKLYLIASKKLSRNTNLNKINYAKKYHSFFSDYTNNFM